MKLVTNTQPVVTGNMMLSFKDNRIELDNDFCKILETGTIFKLVAVDSQTVYLSSKDGDVVVGIGDIEVSDMKTYMQGLSSLEEGKVSVVKVKRGKKIIEFEVQF